jgi:hypothetical protein
MSYVPILFAPLVVLLPAAGAVDGKREISGESAIAQTKAEAPATAERYASPPAVPVQTSFEEGSPFRRVAEAFRGREANQVRIEQRVTIRVSPRLQVVRPNMLLSMPGRASTSRLVEKKMGKCLKVGGIAGVQPDGGNRLLLFMRDQRIVGAELERSCRARDFYSGFYLSRSDDGKLCVDRDTLLSRSGANCKLTRIRQLVESDD